MSRLLLLEGTALVAPARACIDDLRFTGRLPVAERRLLRRVVALERMVRAKSAQARVLRAFSREETR